jgi:hypothetical protein
MILFYLLLYNFEKGNKEIHINYTLLELLLQNLTVVRNDFLAGSPLTQNSVPLKTTH